MPVAGPAPAAACAREQGGPAQSGSGTVHAQCRFGGGVLEGGYTGGKARGN